MSAVLLLCLYMSSILFLVIGVLLYKDGNLFGGVLTDLGVELGILDAAGKIPKTVVKEGKKALEVLLRKGAIHGEGSNASMTIKPKQFFPSESCRVRFKLWFDDAFEWNETSSHRVGGKLGGFRIGTGPSTGGRYSDSGASFRLVFRRNRGANAYMYPQLRGSSSNPSWDELDQCPALRAQSYQAMGVHIFAPEPKREAQLFFKSGQWNDVEMFCKLNTPGKQDGVMELAVNGQRRRLDCVRYRYTKDMLIERFYLEVFFGGGSKEYAPSTDVRLWYADFSFGSS